jgi:hypothetical protein
VLASSQFGHVRPVLPSLVITAFIRFAQFGHRLVSTSDLHFISQHEAGTKSSRRALAAITFGGEKPMQAAIDRVMQTYGMITKLTDEETRAAREKVSSHLAEKPDATEHQLAVEGLRYLRSVRELS